MPQRRAADRRIVLVMKSRGVQPYTSGGSHTSQISWESAPGKTTRILPGFQHYPFEMRQEFHNNIQDILYPQGRDLLAEVFGLPTNGVIQGVGAYKGETNPGSQTLVLLPHKGPIDEGMRRKIDGYASAIGYLLGQDAMAWHYPVEDREPNPDEEDGVAVDLGRPATPEEVQKLYAVISQMTGHEEYAPIASPSGMRFLNFGQMPNRKFHAVVEAAVNAALPEIAEGIELGSFKADTGWIENAWDNEDQHNGESYLDRIAATGSQDIFGRLARTLEGKISDEQRSKRSGNRYHPGYDFGGDVGESDPDKARKPIELEHYSKEKRTLIDPAHFGSAQAGAETARADDPNFVPRSYYYMQGTVPEPRFLSNTRHRVTVPAALYDYKNDPAGYKDALQHLHPTDRMTAYERAIASNGWDGYAHRDNPHAIVMFRPVKLGANGEGTLLGPDHKPLNVEKKKEDVKKARRFVVIRKATPSEQEIAHEALIDRYGSIRPRDIDYDGYLAHYITPQGTVTGFLKNRYNGMGLHEGANEWLIDNHGIHADAHCVRLSGMGGQLGVQMFPTITPEQLATIGEIHHYQRKSNPLSTLTYEIRGRNADSGWSGEGYHELRQHPALAVNQTKKAQRLVVIRKAETTPEHPWITRAKEIFGTTDNPNEAGFILPDGQLIDLSGRKTGDFTPGKTGLYGSGRHLEHSELTRVLPEGERENATHEDVQQQTGMVRFWHNTPDIGISITGELTPQQHSVLHKFGVGKRTVQADFNIPRQDGGWGVYYSDAARESEPGFGVEHAQIDRMVNRLHRQVDRRKSVEKAVTPAAARYGDRLNLAHPIDQIGYDWEQNFLHRIKRVTHKRGTVSLMAMRQHPAVEQHPPMEDHLVHVSGGGHHRFYVLRTLNPENEPSLPRTYVYPASSRGDIVAPAVHVTDPHIDNPHHAYGWLQNAHDTLVRHKNQMDTGLSNVLKRVLITRKRDQGTLLRPSQAPATSPEELLRPSQAAVSTTPESQLLRPSGVRHVAIVRKAKNIPGAPNNLVRKVANGRLYLTEPGAHVLTGHIKAGLAGRKEALIQSIPNGSHITPAGVRALKNHIEETRNEEQPYSVRQNKADPTLVYRDDADWNENVHFFSNGEAARQYSQVYNGPNAHKMHYQNLMNGILHAKEQGGNGSITVIYPHMFKNPFDMKRTARHEETHRASHEVREDLGDNQGILKTFLPSVDWDLERKHDPRYDNLEQVKFNLRQRGYREHQLIEEALAHLAAGQHEKLNMSQDSAKKALAYLLDLGVRHHGEKFYDALSRGAIFARHMAREHMERNS